MSSISPNELRGKRQTLIAEAKRLNDAGDLDAAGAERFEQIKREVEAIDGKIHRSVAMIGWETPAPEGGQSGRRVPPSAEIGMSQRDIRGWNFLRAVNACATGNWKSAGLELEASRAVAQQLGREPRSFFVPQDIMAAPGRVRERRDLTITTEGADVKATAMGSLIDILRNKMILTQAGVTVISGLVGDLQLPRKSGTSTASWLAEQGAASESTPTTDKVTLQPKTVGGFMDLSRKFIQQASFDANEFAENDLASTLAVTIDAAGLHGTGASNEPTGIAATSGIGSVAGGTNGLAPTWAHLVQLETEVAQDNADAGKLAYITNAKVRAKLKQTVVVGSTDSRMIWAGGDRPLNDYPALITNQVSSTLTKGTSSGVCSAIFFGDWTQLIMGLWGGLDILVDPYTASTKGDVRVVAFQDVDFQVRHPEAFAAMLDALTT